MTIQPQSCGHRCRQTIAAIALGFFALCIGSPTWADVPEQTRITDILGNSSELRIRRSGRPESVQIGTVMQRVRDALITVPPNNARAMLRFLSASGDDLNFYVQTNPHPEAAIYYFPCQVQGGDYLIGWGLASNAARGCATGLQVTRGGAAAGAIAPSDSDWALAPKAVAQAPTRQIFYCVGADRTGSHGFATSTTGDPCSEAITQCEATGGDCAITSTGFWWTSEPQLQASLVCEAGTVQTLSGRGDELDKTLASLVDQATGIGCSAQVYRPDDVVILPAADDVVQAQGSDEILIQTRSTPEGLRIDVLKGAVNVLTAGDPAPKSLLQGDRYIHTYASGQVTAFDREAALTSVDMEVLCAFASNSADRLRVGACEEGLGIDTTAGIPVAFCNREQASGGQAGDRRFVQMSASQGEIGLEYEMFDVPDRLQIFHEGVQILDTGFVSGHEALTVPIAGRSGRLEVVVTGNAAIDTTEWNYLLTCP